MKTAEEILIDFYGNPAGKLPLTDKQKEFYRIPVKDCITLMEDFAKVVLEEAAERAMDAIECYPSEQDAIKESILSLIPKELSEEKHNHKPVTEVTDKVDYCEECQMYFKEEEQEESSFCYSESVNGYRCKGSCGMPRYCETKTPLSEVVKTAEIMTSERKKLIERYQKWLDTNPAKGIIAAQCATIAQEHAKAVLEEAAEIIEKQPFEQVKYTTHGTCQVLKKKVLSLIPKEL